ncbi:patatin-like phospholipase family protein [Dyella acidiphila]|uniref:Patatin-like phospholipase family protein n=1 Tax=Dyella acidiphila TaxID=2775866 RepID=A0ABR9GDP1_9GAMM|nr:patatin-like phospholipase family protein [Dyella acidiphila]MBE1162142.1 patatin-like phospholipase family protein [Dyella acidiphila]
MAVTDLRNESSRSETPRKPTIALALGAGGAKGLAHIGAIEELEAQGFQIVAIAGCSMGALVGGVHAMGKLDVYRDWVCSLDKFDVLKLVDWSFSFAGGGLIKGEKIIGTMLELIGDTSIEELPIAFTAVATDIEREREVWLTRGSLFDAIRASIAIPTLFRPHAIEGRVLVDGALLNPVPVTPLIRDPADFVIAVSIDGPADTNVPVEISAGDASAKLSIGRLLSRFLPGASSAKIVEAKAPEMGALELLGQSIDLMQANLSRLRLAAYQPDLLVQLPRNVSSAYAFYRARELIEMGREKTREALAGWNPTSR